MCLYRDYLYLRISVGATLHRRQELPALVVCNMYMEGLRNIMYFLRQDGQCFSLRSNLASPALCLLCVWRIGEGGHGHECSVITWPYYDFCLFAFTNTNLGFANASDHEQFGLRTNFPNTKASRMTYCVSGYEYASRQHRGAISYEHQRRQCS